MYALLGTASAIGLSAGLYHFGPNIFLNWLADGNIYVTRVKEGTAKAIMRGGGLDHFIMRHEGYHLNDPRATWFEESQPKWEVLPNRVGVGAPKYDSRSNRYKNIGLYAVGFPAPFAAFSVFKYEFHWVETRLDRATGMLMTWSRSRTTERIYTSKFPYVVIVDAAETNDLIPVNVELQLLVRITNPYKALFGVENWMEAVTGKVLDVSRSHVGDKTYSALKSEAKPTDTSPSVQKFWDAIKAIKENLMSSNGVEVESVSVMKIYAVGPNAAKIEEDAARAFTATQVAEALVIEARAAATAETVRGEAAAKVTEMTGAAEGAASKSRLDGFASDRELARDMMITDAIGKSGANTTLIDPFGAVSGIAREVAKTLSGRKGD